MAPCYCFPASHVACSKFTSPLVCQKPCDDKKTRSGAATYVSIHSNSATAVTSSPSTSLPTSQSTCSPSTSSDLLCLIPITAVATTTANNDPITTTTASNNSLQVTATTANNAGQVIPSGAGQLQPQHLINLCQAALQLSGNLLYSSPPLLLPTDTLALPAITAQTSAFNQPVIASHPPQQEDQLSEAFVFIATNPSAGISSIPTTSCNHVPLDITPDPTSSLPPVPACLRECIIAGEFIDFNTLLSSAMFSMRKSPTLHQAPLPSPTLQGSHQHSSFTRRKH